MSSSAARRKTDLWAHLSFLTFLLGIVSAVSEAKLHVRALNDLLLGAGDT